MQHATVPFSHADPPPTMPVWIRESEAYSAMGLSRRHTLHTLARLADGMTDDGSLRPILGGKRVEEASGQSRRTVWRNIRYLQNIRMLVLLHRGGPMVAGRTGNHANMYGIPGSRGCLDHLRAHTPMRVMRHLGGQVYKPVDHDPGEQLPLLDYLPQQDEQPGHEAPVSDQPTTPDAPVSGADRRPSDIGCSPDHPTDTPCSGEVKSCQSGTGGRAKVARGVVPKWHGGSCQSGTPSGIWNGLELDGGGARGEGSDSVSGSPRLADIRREDLASTERLLQLHEQAARAGWCNTGERDRLRVVACACRALRIGDNPPALFRSLVSRQLWDRISQADEDEASERLRQHLSDGLSAQRGAPEPNPPKPKSRDLSPDACAIRDAVQAARANGIRTPTLTLTNMQALLPQVFRGWTADRWYAARHELEQS